MRLAPLCSLEIMRYYPEFPQAIPRLKAGSYVFLTRPPLDIATPLDLHVLGIPPAFNLSQDQTLQLICKTGYAQTLG